MPERPHLRNKNALNLALLFALAVPNASRGDVVFDASVPGGTPGDPAFSELDGPRFVIREEHGVLSDGGAALFHSFTSFDLDPGVGGDAESAVFEGANSIARIVARVTGGTQSQIFGSIEVEPQGADFFFLNPAGVLFGAGSSLDTSGSVHISTADRISLGAEGCNQGGGCFGLGEDDRARWTDETPSAFLFESSSPSAIQVVDTFLDVDPDQTLSLIGGDLRFDRTGNVAVRRSTLVAPSGDIVLVSAADRGAVRLEAETGVFSDASGLPSRGTIELREGLGIRTDGIDIDEDPDVPAEQRIAGRIFIRGGDVFMRPSANTAPLLTATSTNGAPSGGEGVGIDIEAVLLDISTPEDAPILAASSKFGSVRNGTDIQIRAETITIDGGVISAQSFGSGSAGEITFEGGEIRISGESFFANGALQDGNGGRVRLVGDVISLDQITILTEALGTGSSADIDITASESIDIRRVGENPRALSDLSARSERAGTPGVIAISAPVVSISGVRIGVDASDRPPAPGEIRIDGSDSLVLSNSTVSATGSGPGSNRRITLTGGAVQINGSSISSDLQFQSGQDAGSIEIRGQSIAVGDGSSISAESNGRGTAGSVTLAAAGSLTIAGGTQNRTRISSSARGLNSNANRVELVGDSVDIENADVTAGLWSPGAVSIRANSLRVGPGAVVTTSTFRNTAGTVDLSARRALRVEGGRIESLGVDVGPFGASAGAITLNAPDIELVGGSVAATSATAEGGNILVAAERSVRALQSTFETNVATGDGDGGDINIAAPAVILSDARLTTSAEAGRGGDITVSATVFPRSLGTVIAADSATNLPGNIVFRVTEEQLPFETTIRPVAFESNDRRLAARCDARPNSPGSLYFDSDDGPRPDPFGLLGPGPL